MAKVMELCEFGSVSDVLRKLQGPLKEQEIRIIAAEVESMESVESVLIYCRMIVSAMRGFHLFNFGKFLQKWQLAWHDGT
eukprot:symbB.v1.2.024823.t1/scaffold2374.1/size162163/5